jgi:NAD(P)-dependent dehydrogenase (short-subunit alcohol dehydrogenase family)
MDLTFQNGGQKMALDLRGKTAVITGGNSGIGLSTALALADAGARVAITGRDPATLEAAQGRLGDRGLALQADTSDLAALDGVRARVADTFGRVDLLFVNAGVAQFRPYDQVDEAFYDQLFDINTKGAFFAAQKLLPLLQHGSSVVFNTSVVDVLGMPNTSVYAATKAALRSYVRTFAAELLPRGIRVNAVSPGPITTPIVDRMGFDEDTKASFSTMLRESNPMKRFGTPEEVAQAVLYLAFQATYTTGTELAVDGGLTQL